MSIISGIAFLRNRSGEMGLLRIGGINEHGAQTHCRNHDND